MLIQSLGIGSGIDVNSIVDQLVAAERAPQAQRLDRREINTQADISALGTLKASLGELQSSIEGFDGDDLFDSKRAAVEDGNRLSASATSDAAVGAVEVEVEALAQSHRLRSTAFAGVGAAVGTGTLSIDVGGESFSLDIDRGNNSLAAIRDAINDAPDNPGVSASVITGDDGAHLVLTAEETGTANAITVTASGGDGGLDQLVYDPGTLTNLTEVRAPADAIAVFDGVRITDGDNVIDSALEGVSLTLKEAAPGETTTLTVSRDTGGITGKVASFVDTFNAAMGTLDQVSRADPEGNNSGALVGDPLPRSVQSRLRSITGGAFDSDFRTLSEIGITTNVEGQLQLDKARLGAALADDTDAVAAVFQGETGLAVRMGEALGGLLGSGGQIQSRTDSLGQRLEGIADERIELSRRIARLESRLVEQFSAMDQLVSELQSTGDFLSQQLAALNRDSG